MQTICCVDVAFVATDPGQAPVFTREFLKLVDSHVLRGHKIQGGGLPVKQGFLAVLLRLRGSATVFFDESFGKTS